MTRFLILMLLLCSAALAHAGEVRVAVAANFTEPMQQIAADFQKETGHVVKLSFGSSGKFYAQIQNGAPFDVLLSADNKTPKALEDGQLAVAGSRFVYAVGKLVLWSADANLVDAKGEILQKGSFNKLAYADPKLAPYGQAAKETLEALKLWEKLQPKLITGENIIQTWQFAATGNAQLALVAMSQIIKEKQGSYWVIPENLYRPIQQSAVLLTIAKDKAAAEALLNYLKGDKAKAVMRGFGYAF